MTQEKSILQEHEQHCLQQNTLKHGVINIEFFPPLLLMATSNEINRN